MARIIETPKDRIIMIEFSEDETDKLREISYTNATSMNEAILSCFLIGIMKQIREIMQDKLPT